jgi:hypothetical protein
VASKGASKRKPAKRSAAKKSAPKPKPKPKPAKAAAARDEQREVHYSDLRKVMLQSVLKRLK